MILGFVADAHGNVEALRVALTVLGDAGAGMVLFLGDSVGYLPGGAAAREVVARGLPAVRGNHEAMMLGVPYDAASERIYRLEDARAELDDEVLAALASWPDHRVLDLPCGEALLVHGTPTEPVFGYAYSDTDLSQFDPRGARLVLMANTHRPFVRDLGDIRYVNVGSCGLPRDDGSLGSACVLDDATAEVTVLRFDISDATAAALDRCGPVADEVLGVLARRGQWFGTRCD